MQGQLPFPCERETILYLGKLAHAWYHIMNWSTTRRLGHLENSPLWNQRTAETFQTFTSFVNTYTHMHAHKLNSSTSTQNMSYRRRQCRRLSESTDFIAEGAKRRWDTSKSVQVATIRTIRSDRETDKYPNRTLFAGRFSGKFLFVYF